MPHAMSPPPSSSSASSSAANTTTTTTQSTQPTDSSQQSITINDASPTAPPPRDPSLLPPEALAFASRMFDAARKGDLAVFQQALPAGLPPNLTNEKGDTLVRPFPLPIHFTVLCFFLFPFFAPPSLFRFFLLSPILSSILQSFSTFS